ncbi:uncharacterized protein [Drosophila virilis]|uniref:uncharacterized protein n=1 Tax=Drosophila virilis TaxID=7244 RepID=UPI0038B3F0BF
MRIRTVSDEAALVIAGMIRTAARMQSMERWQARWDRSSKGRWTHRLIPNLEAWISRKSYLKRFGHDNTDECSWCGSEIAEDANHTIFECGRFSVNRQGLEDNLRRPITVDNLVRNNLFGHGCFRSYLKRFGHDNTDECSWCGSEIAEDANHTIFECGRFSVNRQGLEDNLRRPITVDNLVRNKLKTAQKWEATYTFAAEVMLELRRVERNRWRAEEV